MRQFVVGTAAFVQFPGLQWSLCSGITEYGFEVKPQQKVVAYFVVGGGGGGVAVAYCLAASNGCRVDILWFKHEILQVQQLHMDACVEAFYIMPVYISHYFAKIRLGYEPKFLPIYYCCCSLDLGLISQSWCLCKLLVKKLVASVYVACCCCCSRKIQVVHVDARSCGSVQHGCVACSFERLRQSHPMSDQDIERAAHEKRTCRDREL